MTTEQLTLIVHFEAKKGKEEELGKRLLALIEPTHQEAGCINYTLHRATDNEGVWMLYESWRSKKDLDEHLAMPYLKDFIAAAPELLEGEMNFRFYDRQSQPAPALR